jgi:hypothetical protein
MSPSRGRFGTNTSDPEHKLVLRSKDDVLFRVSMFHLSKAR